MNMLEQDLRRELSESGRVDARRTDTARAEAVDAFVRCRRRARLRRSVSMSSGALSIAAIGALLVLSLPAGDDRVSRPGAPDAPLAFPVLSTLDRPATQRDRVVSSAIAVADLASARWIAETPRFSFMVARGASPGELCVLAGEPSPEQGAAPDVVTAVCSKEDVLASDGVIALAERRDGRIDVGGAVADGIDEVVLGDRRIPVRENGFAVAWNGGLPGTITLVGPAAARVGQSDPQPGVRRGSLADGTPTVTVAFLPSVGDDSPVGADVVPGALNGVSDPNVTPVVEVPVVSSLPPIAPEPSGSPWSVSDVIGDADVTPVVETPVRGLEPVPGTDREPVVAPSPPEDVWFP